MEYLIPLSVFSLVCFVSTYFWGIRGAIVCQIAPFILGLIAVLVLWAEDQSAQKPPLLNLLGVVSGVAVLAGPLLVVGFIISALAIAFRSFIRRTAGR
jgi:hypothetical protein